ncbi:AGC protein kinase [Saprolegnia diclina VS20]|uniref:cGMP-dependent protein kinase n=1 Tax=Saprolegnia diclina (strain VS20) TaxID=1156394 RepID=T0Q585_SAPDV|nr:AGC protein kinase [Saprolegnia diclina VS20]EQC32974.1 AGC protein kinase [Saprolegnia diclina VS20]|eukprot:XP_008613660.1 AGC protein kinase [Saprolegnia diclina VS20]
MSSIGRKHRNSLTTGQIQVSVGGKRSVLAPSEAATKVTSPTVMSMKSVLHACQSVFRRPRIRGRSIEPESEMLLLPRVAKSNEAIRIISKALRAHYLFQTLEDAQLLEVAHVMDLVTHNDGDEVITQGDTGNAFFVLEAGSCQILVDDKVVGHYVGGQAFGELALLYNAPRAATIKATSPCTLWKIDRVIFRKIATTAEMQSQKARLDFLKQVDFLKHLGDKPLRKIVDVLRMEYFGAGASIIRQGDEGNTFYMIVQGSVLCSSEHDEHLVTLHAGQYFGERALLTNEPRKVNCVAETNATCYMLGRRDFTQLLGPLQTLLDRQVRLRTLRSITLLSHLSDPELDLIALAFRTVSFTDGQKIIRQGEIGNTFFIIQQGVVSVQKAGVQVLQLRSGEFFGERTLLHNEPRAADVVASGPVECLSLDRPAFERCLSKLRAVMADEAKRQELIQASILGTPVPASKHLDFAELEKIDTIGAGTFGHVFMVKHKPSGMTYALKCMPKHNIVATHQVLNILNEKRIICECTHPFILRLVDTFADRDQLYMVLELVQGGELWSLLYEKSFYLPKGSTGGFDVPTARFYAATVVEVFRYLQTINVAYRDLKPENLMLDDKGYLKMVDFGFAKHIPFFKQGALCEKTFTVCGTQEYMAPEILLQKGHGIAVDHWALGCLIYELLVGHTPFYSDCHDDLQVVWNVLHAPSTLRFPHGFDPEAKDLISKLLEPNPRLRLGSLPGGMNDVMLHPWFSTACFDWTALRTQTLTAPYTPPIKDALDLSQFGHFPKAGKIVKYNGEDYFADF